MSEPPPIPIPFEFKLVGKKSFTVSSSVPSKWTVLVDSGSGSTPMRLTVLDPKNLEDKPRTYTPTAVPVPTPGGRSSGASGAADLVLKTRDRIQELVADFETIQPIVTDSNRFQNYKESDIDSEYAVIQTLTDHLDTELRSPISLDTAVLMQKEADGLMESTVKMQTRLSNFLEQTEKLQTLNLAPDVLAAAKDIQTAVRGATSTADLDPVIKRLDTLIGEIRSVVPSWTVSDDLRQKIRSVQLEIRKKLGPIMDFQKLTSEIVRLRTPPPVPALTSVSKFKILLPAKADPTEIAQITRLLNGLQNSAATNPYLKIAWKSYPTNTKNPAVLEQIKTREIAAFGRPIAEKLNEIRVLY